MWSGSIRPLWRLNEPGSTAGWTLSGRRCPRGCRTDFATYVSEVNLARHAVADRSLDETFGDETHTATAEQGIDVR